MSQSVLSLIAYTLVMAVVTYLIRMLPFVVFRTKIENRFIKSFLFYVPYAVLGAMTFPAIFYSTGSFIPSLCGCIVSLVLAYFGRGLLTVAISACGTALIVQWIVNLF